MRAAALRTILAGVLALASATGLQSCTETSAADAELLPAESAQVIAVVDGDTIDVQTAGERRACDSSASIHPKSTETAGKMTATRKRPATS